MTKRQTFLLLQAVCVYNIMQMMTVRGQFVFLVLDESVNT